MHTDHFQAPLSRVAVSMPWMAVCAAVHSNLCKGCLGRQSHKARSTAHTHAVLCTPMLYAVSRLACAGSSDARVRLPALSPQCDHARRALSKQLVSHQDHSDPPALHHTCNRRVHVKYEQDVTQAGPHTQRLTPSQRDSCHQRRPV